MSSDMGYVGFQMYTDQELVANVGIEIDPNTPLLEVGNDDDDLLSPPEAESVSIMKKKHYPAFTAILVVLCTLLTVSLIAVSLLWVARDNNDSNKKKRENNSKSLKHFFQISDTHLDIYYDSHVTSKSYQGCRNVKHRKGGEEIKKSDTTAMFGRLKCDSPAKLLESMKTHMTKLKDGLESGVEFVIMTGDQSAHSYDYFDVDVLESVLWSISNSTKYISDGLPGVPIYMTVGNNDLKIDYIPPFGNHSVFYQKLHTIFEPYVFPQNSNVSTLNSKEEFKKTFELGGFYSMKLEGGRILLIVLNTNYWSAKSYKINRNVTVAGDVQLAWFTDQLHSARAKKQKVIISGHIPPGISAYDGVSFWLRNYTEAYISMTTNASINVIGQLYGHIHSDRFKLQYRNDAVNMNTSRDKSYLLTAPSLTPVYGSNPAFRVFDYDSQLETLADYHQYYIDLAASNVNKKAYWLLEYSFKDTYNKDLSSDNMEKVINDFLDPSSPAWFYYSRNIKAKMGGIPYYLRYHEYCCAKHVNEEVYKNCSRTFKNIGA